VRLTLRTLLAYLDDMLDPAETKRIGQKVAESEHAQELIARIKQVTRRRRLTTPPATGPNAFEPNTVADYLDNTLPPEQVAEVEKACLESDVHLAEIAAAHQILTLVLGQPALVPPTARQRMYALVQGNRVARPRPVAAAAATPNGAAAAGDARADEDETLLLGLPAVGREAVMRWLLPLAAVLLVIVLAIAIWQALSPTGGGTSVAANNGNTTPPTQPSPPEATHKEGPPSDGGDKPGAPSGGNEGQKPGGGSSTETPAQPAVGSTPVVRPEPPSRERREAGRYRLAPPSILVSRTSAAPSEPWKRLKSDDKVFTTDPLVSLPGYHSDLRLNSGVDLQLWGNTYELNNPMVPLLESAVVLHVPPPGLDADFTLDRGAVKFINTKDAGPAAVRLRFAGEIWDVQLKDPGTEIGVTLFGRHVQPYGSGLPPSIDLYLYVLKGTISVRVTPYREFDNITSQPGAAPYVLSWDNVGNGAQAPVPAQDRYARGFLGVFSKPRGGLPDEVQKLIEDTNIALDAVSKRLSGPGRIETGLIEMVQPAEITPLNGMNALLAVRSLGALDAVGDLIHILEDADKPPMLRQEAMFTLRHWTGRNDGQEAKLYDPKTGSGALTGGGKYNRGEAETIMSLLHSLTPEQLRTPDTWAYLIENLKHDKLAIRELSFYHLRHNVPGWQKISYNPADPSDRRETAYKEWKKLIPDGKLPPPPQRP
jgi:hypothetical protein